MKQRELIRKMQYSKSYASYLSEYTASFCSMYEEYASIHLAYSYYTVFEILSEEPKCDWADSWMRRLNHCLLQTGDAAVAEGLRLRGELTKTMESITRCSDLMSIYEHILDRVEYRFMEPVSPDLDVLITRIEQFLFSDKDAVVTNEKIKSIVSELPIRMTRQRFYDILSDSLGLYKDSDERSVQDFIYQIRTVAGLSEDVPPVTGLEQLSDYLVQCRTAQFENMSQDDWKALTREFQSYTDQITTMVNVYMQIQECLNHFCTIQLCRPHAHSQGSTVRVAEAMVSHILERGGKEDAQRVLDGCNTHLEELEGRQETVLEALMPMEALLHDVLAEFPEDPAMRALATSEKLVSSSLFIDLNEPPESPAVTSAYLRQATDALLEEFAQFFRNHTATLNRAVMSQVLGTLPVFFNTTDEIMEYIRYSLERCSNEAELSASVDIVNMIIE